METSAAVVLLGGVALFLAVGLLGTLRLLGFPAAHGFVLPLVFGGMVIASVQGVLSSLFNGQERHKLFAWLNAGAVAVSAIAGVGVLSSPR